MFFFSIVRAGDAIYVRVGDHDLTQKFGSPGAQTLRVATTYIHHNHNSQTLDNDIALLKLHGDAELKEGVCLVRNQVVEMNLSLYLYCFPKTSFIIVFFLLGVLASERHLTGHREEVHGDRLWLYGRE